MRSKKWLLLGIVATITIAALPIYFPGRATQAIDSRERNTISAFRTTIARIWHHLRGEMVDVGGYSLRFQCFGAGSPTVIMDAGLGMARYTWNQIPQAIAGFTRVCVYDRAGLGGSDPAPLPRTSQQMVDELYRLLCVAGIQHPYLLVGHSLGGVNMRLFASQHPEAVMGLILLDATTEDWFERFMQYLPPEEAQVFARHERGENPEGVDIVTSIEQLRRAGPLPPIPVLILSPARPPTVTDDEWNVHYELQVALARRIPGSQHILVTDTDHFIQWHRPDAVIEAVQQLARAVRPPPR